INNSSISVIGNDGSSFSSSDITSVTFNSSNQLVFTLKDVSYRKYSIQSANNVIVAENTIIFSDFNYNAIASPENWFTWSGNQITGLSTLGTQQTNIVLPPRATSIASKVFYKNKKIISVDMSLTKITSLPDALNPTTTREGLFSFSSNLVSISLPKSLTSIGSYAFSDCTRLTSITIPYGVTSIGKGILLYCISLPSITFPNSITTLSSGAVEGCSSLTSITIPDSVTSIEDFVFENCYGLTSITIPDSVTSIGQWCFYGCKSLTSITIPDSVTSIGPDSFYNVPSTCVMNVSSTWNKTLATNAGYTGTFNTSVASTKYGK
ncbi:MAG: leucine-rich repeat domain-containing protein, partial [Ureaplasma sp.]|nr:leucine-rich repeat domain-containing protein [Ureaplasma sp.]